MDGSVGLPSSIREEETEDQSNILTIGEEGYGKVQSCEGEGVSLLQLIFAEKSDGPGFELESILNEKSLHY